MPKRVGNVELYMGPKQVGGPDDLEQAIIKFIKGAKKRLDIAVQELDSEKIARAIVNARKRKVQVRLVVEGDYLRAGEVSANPWKPGGKYEINRQIQNAILRTAVNIRSDYNPNIFHQKFIVRDSNALLTGSTNFTDSGTSTNLNHLIIVRSRKVAVRPPIVQQLSLAPSCRSSGPPTFFGPMSSSTLPIRFGMTAPGYSGAQRQIWRPAQPLARPFLSHEVSVLGHLTLRLVRGLLTDVDSRLVQCGLSLSWRDGCVSTGPSRRSGPRTYR